MAITNTTVAAATIEERVSSFMQDTLIQESVMLPTIDDRSSEAGQGMDTLKIGKQSSLSTQDVDEDNALTPAAPTIGTDDLVFDKHKSVAWAISDKATVQSKMSILEGAISNAGREHAADIDRNIIASMVAGTSASTPDHIIEFDNSTDLSDADVREAKRLLKVQNVPEGDRFLLLGPGAEKALLGVSNFIEVQKYGADTQALSRGELGMLYGFRVVVTSDASNLPAGNALFYHRSAQAFAVQAGIKFESDRNVLAHRDEYSMSILYGTKNLDSGKRQVLFNSTGS